MPSEDGLVQITYRVFAALFILICPVGWIVTQSEFQDQWLVYAMLCAANTALISLIFHFMDEHRTDSVDIWATIIIFNIGLYLKFYILILFNKYPTLFGEYMKGRFPREIEYLSDYNLLFSYYVFVTIVVAAFAIYVGVLVKSKLLKRWRHISLPSTPPRDDEQFSADYDASLCLYSWNSAPHYPLYIQHWDPVCFAFGTVTVSSRRSFFSNQPMVFANPFPMDYPPGRLTERSPNTRFGYLGLFDIWRLKRIGERQQSLAVANLDNYFSTLANYQTHQLQTPGDTAGAYTSSDTFATLSDITSRLFHIDQTTGITDPK